MLVVKWMEKVTMRFAEEKREEYPFLGVKCSSLIERICQACYSTPNYSRLVYMMYFSDTLGVYYLSV